MSKLVYISGPITQGCQFRNIGVAMETFDMLMDTGIYSYCPHWTAFQQIHRPRLHREWLRFDIEAMLPRCNAVLRIEGPSDGADEECRVATRLGLPIFHTIQEVIHWHQACEQSDAKALVTEGSV